MKISNWKIGALAATLAVVATTAYAQTAAHALKANIPFTFQVRDNRTLQPGEYYISRNGQMWTFTNTETLHHVLAPSLYSTQGELKEKGSLVFACHANSTSCSLRSINPGSGEVGGYWAPPKTGKADKDQTASIVVIPLSLAR